MNHGDFVRAASDARRQLAEAAVTAPHLLPEFAAWRGRVQELEQAKARLAEAEAAWLRRIEPAMDDPLLRKLAEERGLLPATKEKR